MTTWLGKWRASGPRAGRSQLSSPTSPAVAADNGTPAALRARAPAPAAITCRLSFIVVSSSLFRWRNRRRRRLALHAHRRRRIDLHVLRGPRTPIHLLGRARMLEALARLHDVPADHHGVVLVDDVVAVHDVLAEEVRPAHDQLQLVAGQQDGHVAPPAAHEFAHLGEAGGVLFFQGFALGALVAEVRNILFPVGYAIDLQEQELDEVAVDGVRPVAPAVAEGPDLGAPLVDAGVDAVGVHDLAVDRPQSPFVVEGEDSLALDLGEIDARPRPELPVDSAV